MARWEMRVLLCVLCYLTSVSAQTWDPPYYIAPPPGQPGNVVFLDFQGTTRVNTQMDEVNVEDAAGVLIATMVYSGEIAPVLGSLSVPIGLQSRKNNDGQWELFVSKSVDHETQDFLYTISVSAAGSTGEIRLFVNDINDNAPYFDFSGGPTECKVAESFLGATTCKFTIKDADEKFQDNTIFKATSPGLDLTLEHVYTTDSIEATLLVNAVLDFESSRVHSIILTAQVNENDPQDLIGRTTIILEVEDIADTNPYWLSRPPSVFSTKEDETNSFTFQAADGDYGIDANILYELNDDAPVEITLETNVDGARLTVAPIDREALTEASISITVKAYEDGNPDAAITENILIMIEDVNDNLPEVTLDVTEVNVTEETLSSIGVVITVDDPDLGTAGSYSITLEDESGDGTWASAFSVVPKAGYNKQTFTLTITEPSKLDFEDDNWKTFKLKIKATETEDETHSTEAELTINLVDQNDETPEFLLEPYNVTLLENVTIGYAIVTLQAIDNDVQDTIKYKLVTRNSAVALDETTGELTVARNNAFNAEVQSEIILQAEARDSANHVAFTTINIIVQDINDTPPTFDEVTIDMEEVPEGSLEGMEVTSTIRASDPDSSAVLELSIDWEKTRATAKGVPVLETTLYIGCLDIATLPDPNPPAIGASIIGNITILNSELVNYENFDILYLVIVVTDTATETNNRFTSATLTINIGNINDEKPEFIPSTINSKKTIAENQVNNNTLIGYILAIDPDELDSITYSLRVEDDTPEDWVYIDGDSGELRAVGNVDSKIDSELFTQLKYTVIASDGAFATEQSIVIEVEDRNDNIPTFDDITEEIPISEDATSGMPITTVRATDGDISDWYKKLYYDLDPTQPNYGILDAAIVVDNETGEVNVADLGEGSFLDADNPVTGRKVDVVIRVRDNYPPDPNKPAESNEARKTIILQLVDVNDNKPEFDVYAPRTITEDEKQGSTIYPGIQGTDADEPNTPFSILTYNIINVRVIEGNVLEDTIFALSTPNIEGMVDILAAVNLLGYVGKYEITIEGCDSDEIKPECAEVKVEIDITDINDNTPEFTFPEFTGQQIRIKKDQTVGATLIQASDEPLPLIAIIDEDLDDNGFVDFDIAEVSEGYEEYFELIPENGGKSTTLVLKKLFEEETPPPIDMTIHAKDRGIPEPREQSISFKIYVIDQTSQPPVFSEPSDTTEFPENDPNPTYDIPQAEDPNNINLDPEDYEQINYFLVEGNEEGFFNLVDGKLILNQPLDREEKETHDLKIMTTNEDEPPAEGEGVPGQYFNLIITVKDVADFDPYFENELYPGGIAPSDSSGVEVLRLTAIDEDSREIDKLSYTIDEASMTTSDGSLESVVNPFILDPDFGVLKTNFKPQSNMKGFFEFQVVVTDSQPKSNTTMIKVYIINDSNRVVFEFQNEVDYVNSKRDYIAKVFSDNIGFSCAIDEVSLSSVTPEDSSRNTSITAVRTHFVDTEKNEPLPGKEIEKLALQNWNTMAIEMAMEELILFNIILSPTPEEQNLAEILTIVLIAVSVVLGSLVLILFIAFVIKTRRLNRRIEALSNTKFGSQESGLNRIGMNVPNTNRHAVEGSNPVWNEDVPQYDNQSISSGDSDLIGVEDNPEFHYSKDHTEFRGSQEGGYYSGSDLQAAGRHEGAGHELSTEL